MNHMDMTYQFHDERMKKYPEEAQKMEHRFLGLEARRIQCLVNYLTNKLVRVAGSREPLPSGAFLEVIKTPSIRETPQEEAANEEPQHMLVIEGAEESWLAPIIRAIREQLEDEELRESKTTIAKARPYTILDDVLYKKGASMLLKCIT